LAYCESLPPHQAWPLLQKADSKINHHIIRTLKDIQRRIREQIDSAHDLFESKRRKA
jgi:hypothetical protein